MGLLPIGRRNQLVTIQHLTQVSDGGGGQTETYTTLAREWALIEPLVGNEAQRASQMSSALTTGVTMPFREDISVKDRLTVGARTLEIQSVQDPTARREELRLLCVELSH